MTRVSVFILFLVLILPSSFAEEADVVFVLLETELGSISIRVDTKGSAKAARYWLGFIDRGQYDGATFYRRGSIDGNAPTQLVQGGLLADAVFSEETVVPADFGINTLLDEWQTAEPMLTHHRRGTVSLARDLLDTGSVIPELVFCLRDTPSMNQGEQGLIDSRGFPLIGEVISGLDVIERIAQRDASGKTTIPFLEGQILKNPVLIKRAGRIDGASVFRDTTN